jgi:hypothetical protein
MAGAFRNPPPKGSEDEATEHARMARDVAAEDEEAAEDSPGPRAMQSLAVLMSVRGGLKKE